MSVMGVRGVAGTLPQCGDQTASRLCRAGGIMASGLRLALHWAGNTWTALEKGDFFFNEAPGNNGSWTRFIKS